MPKQESAALPPENAAPPAEAVVSKPMIVAGPVPHALQPVQDGIEAFKSKYGRLPFSLQEMVDMKVLLQVPPLPPNKMYVIDHETGQVRVTSNP